VRADLARYVSPDVAEALARRGGTMPRFNRDAAEESTGMAKVNLDRRRSAEQEALFLRFGNRLCEAARDAVPGMDLTDLDGRGENRGTRLDRGGIGRHHDRQCRPAKHLLHHGIRADGA